MSINTSSTSKEMMVQPPSEIQAVHTTQSIKNMLDYTQHIQKYIQDTPSEEASNRTMHMEDIPRTCATHLRIYMCLHEYLER